MNVLIIEDDASLLSLLTFLIKRSFPKATVTTSEGRDKDIMKRIREEKIDLILLDLLLPLYSGTQLLDVLKSTEDTKHIAVVVITAKVLPKDVEKHLGLGADEFIKKPFDSKELLARLKAVIKRNKILV